MRLLIAVRDQFARVLKMHDEVLFHDDLNVGSTPFLLHQVVADAQQHGLQYLCDASLSRRDLSKYSGAAREVLERFPDDEFMARDQFRVQRLRRPAGLHSLLELERGARIFRGCSGFGLVGGRCEPAEAFAPAGIAPPVAAIRIR